MRFAAREAQARQRSRRLTAAFAAALPPHFIATNTAVTLLLVLGGAWLEAGRLRGGGAALARELGARELSADPSSLPERQLRHIANEMAIAARQPMPRLFVLDAEESINACAAGSGAGSGTKPGVASTRDSQSRSAG